MPGARCTRSLVCSVVSLSPSLVELRRTSRSTHPTRLETSARHQQHCTDCHQENARPVCSEPQEPHAAPWRLQSVASRPAKGSPPKSSACHVQDAAENEQRAKSHQEHSRLSIPLPPTRTRIQADIRRIVPDKRGGIIGSFTWFRGRRVADCSPSQTKGYKPNNRPARSLIGAVHGP
jgi:hypothetical protein